MLCPALPPLQLQMGVTLWRWSINPATHIKNLKIKKNFPTSLIYFYDYSLPYSFPYVFIQLLLSKLSILKKEFLFSKKSLDDVIYIDFLFWSIFICIFLFVFLVHLENIKWYVFYCFGNFFQYQISYLFLIICYKI